MALSDFDRLLIQRCLRREPGAWDDFIDRYLPLITHVVNSTAKLRFGGISHQSRDDIVADILLNLVDDDFAALRQFRGQSSLGTYLVVISRRVALRRMAVLGKNLVVASAVSTEPETIDEDALNLENAEEVRSLLEKMPDSEAVAIRMFHLEHKSYVDIGEHFGIPENSVGPLLSKARKRMRTLKP